MLDVVLRLPIQSLGYLLPSYIQCVVAGLNPHLSVSEIILLYSFSSN